MAKDSIFHPKTNLLLIHIVQGELVIPRDSAIKYVVCGDGKTAYFLDRNDDSHEWFLTKKEECPNASEK
jgi:hypothetical protein